MQNNTVETLIGAIVVAVAAFFLWFAYSTAGSTGVSGYEITAKFASADGITPGTDIRLHGIKIGTVASLTLDPKTYYAIAHLSIRDDIKIPDDSAVKITSSGLLGSSYVAIQPGGSETDIRPGGELTNTQGSVDLMGLIGRAVMGGGK
ncbi:MAG TPA: outer membrane lipid asymmetry maintenance protein MlaD [Rhizomicrobium sp.]|nr:outer membrane lipid asymmetry maintenance protein MlaD [Rhizomicrobium sp.]